MQKELCRVDEERVDTGTSCQRTLIELPGRLMASIAHDSAKSGIGIAVRSVFQAPFSQ